MLRSLPQKSARGYDGGLGINLFNSAPLVLLTNGAFESHMFRWYPGAAMRNEPRKMHRQRRQGLKNVSLQVEKLECRRLLAGLSVSVTIDNSVTGNLQTEVQIPASDRILYIDFNRNGTADSDEPVAITNQAGQAFFAGLEAGDYSIGLLTDNYRQRQISPAVVEQTRIVAAPLPSQWMIGGTDANQSLWALSSDGILTWVSGGSQGPGSVHSSILELGGQPESVVQRTPTEAWISFRTASQSRLAIFNTVSKQLTSYPVSSSARLVDLATDGQSIFGVIKDVSRTDASIVRVEVGPVGLILNEVASGQLSEIEALSANLVVLRQFGANRYVDLLDVQGRWVDSVAVSGSAGGLQVDRVSNSVVVLSDDGTLVLRAANNKLEKVALIAEAVAPMALSSGRMIATDRYHRGELTVWSMANWSPVGHFSVGEVDIRDIKATGLQALLLTDRFVQTLDLAAARPAHVTLDSDEVEQVSFSVYPLVANSTPAVETPQLRTINENQSETIDLRQLVTDANGQTLWYSLVTAPLHGSVQLTNTGMLQFTPADDFFGTDSVKIRVHDGMSSVDVALNWIVVEANRPPLAMHVNIDELPEGLPAGTLIGTVTVVDPNKFDSYQITSADYRFRVEDGKIVLNEPLNFEAGSSIVLNLTAVDALGQFSISGSTVVRLTNVVEPPEGVILSQLSIAENVSNVPVGRLTIVSPDSAGSYQLTIDDARFTIHGDEIWLQEPLNYEQANSVRLNVTVQDTNHPQLVVSTPIQLAVTNQDDQPSEILLNSREVPERTAGAAVGLISVADEDGDRYQFRISDARFVVTDGILRLKEQSSLNRNTELSIPITVTASSTNGSIIVFTFPLTVIPPLSPWQNPSNPVDVNGDNILTPSDALHVINFLNENGSGQIPDSIPGGSGEKPIYPDVNGDGRITPSDALIIINQLNDRSTGSGEAGGGSRLKGEGEGFSDIDPGKFSAWNMEEERRKSNSRIDAELELLLDQLANDLS